MRKIFSVAVGLLLFFVVLTPQLVSARHAQKVLGDATDSSDLSIPPTAEGPGLILPDSPIFFLDELKQNLRLFFAFSPNAKARVHAAVAGERLAELQFMLAKNNDKGIRIALQGVSDNLKKAASDLTEAKLKGKDVTVLARATNDTIKEKQEKLSVLEENARGEMRAQVKAAREALKIAKVEAEDSLPESELENEIEDDLEDEIEYHVRVTNDSTRGLEHAIDVLSRLASEGAKKHQTRREEALRHAIETKNEALRKQQEKQLEFERRKHESLLKAKEKFLQKTRQAVEKADEAVREFQKDKDEIDEVNEKEGPSENSGEGSLNSGSGNSGSGSGGGDSGGSGKD